MSARRRYRTDAELFDALGIPHPPGGGRRELTAPYANRAARLRAEGGRVEAKVGQEDAARRRRQYDRTEEGNPAPC